METNKPDEFRKRLEENLKEAGERLTQAKSAVEYQTQAYLAETDPKEKKQKKRILDREERAVNYANRQYNEARKALGK